VGLLTEAGLDPSVIDVDAFAIHNAFELNHPDAMQASWDSSISVTK